MLGKYKKHIEFILLSHGRAKLLRLKKEFADTTRSKIMVMVAIAVTVATSRKRVLLLGRNYSTVGFV